MNWYDAFWAGVKAAIAAAWTDIPAGNLWVDVQAAKRDWSNLLDSQQMAPPWVVCKIDIQPTTEWGTGAPRFEVATTVFYIAADNVVSTLPSGTRIVNYVMSKLIDLQTRLLSNADNLGTVLSEFTLNSNADNPIESEMLSSDQRFTAGSLTFTSIVLAV